MTNIFIIVKTEHDILEIGIKMYIQKKEQRKTESEPVSIIAPQVPLHILAKVPAEISLNNGQRLRIS